MAALGALLLLTGGCGPDVEHAVLIRVTSQIDVETLTVERIPMDGSAPERVTQPVGRDRASITVADPIRVGILDRQRDIMVRLVAEDGAGGRAVAIRCYSVSGILEDAVLLAGPLDEMVDADADGFPADAAFSCLAPDGSPCTEHACGARAADCDDRNGLAYPGATEGCGEDRDCDGMLGPCADGDGDGVLECAPGDAPESCDCDDEDPLVSPRAEEICGDGLDQTCDGRDTLCDRDGDGSPADREMGGTPDCDDTDPSVGPEAVERCTAMGSEPVDDNCDGRIDELPECAGDDLDNDGAPACEIDPSPGCDCDDCNAAVRPGAPEVCGNAVAEDCEEPPDACLPGDGDGDGYGSAAMGGTDCDDGNPEIHPGAMERCGNGVAEGCVADAPCTEDTDGDGWIEPPECEAAGAGVHPGVPEICDGVDQDCDSVVDETGSCISEAAGPRVVDFATDLDHCGGCRIACDRRRADLCMGGSCMCSASGSGGRVGDQCDPGEVCCTAPPSIRGCHDLTTDFDNCGDCGRACDPATANGCAGSACVCGSGPACAGGRPCCGSACVDTSADFDNCGACGVSCGTGETCVGGRCTCGPDRGAPGDGPACPSSQECCREPKCRSPSSC